MIGIELDSRAFGLTARRAAEENASGSTPTFVTSMFKYYATELGSRRSEATMRMHGFEGGGWEGAEFDGRALRETRAWLGGKAGTIAGGSSEVQLNIIAKRVLGLPDLARRAAAKDVTACGQGRVRGFLAVGLVAVTTAGLAAADPIRAGADVAVVATSHGSVRGYVASGISTFKGIPYARADRFMAPEAPEPWQEPRFMGYYGATCPFDLWAVQARGNGIGMFALQNDWGYPSEDCLSLNIWTPALDDEGKRPVMVWIHGGGWDFGSSHELPYYDGENLARRGDVVVVSVNHRLNVLGFLDLSGEGGKYEQSVNVGSARPRRGA